VGLVVVVEEGDVVAAGLAEVAVVLFERVVPLPQRLGRIEALDHFVEVRVEREIEHRVEQRILHRGVRGGRVISDIFPQQIVVADQLAEDEEVGLADAAGIFVDGVGKC
jgi:hypothetical protein